MPPAGDRPSSSRPGPALLALLVGVAAASWLGGRATLAVWIDSKASSATVTTAGNFAASSTYYLHNNPTPPLGATAAQANLPMTVAVPTATTLFNYDLDHDGDPGRLLLRTVNGLAESGIASYQNWRAPAAPAVQLISGSVTFTFWSAMRSFEGTKAATVTVFLRDFDPLLGTYLEISNATLSLSPWQQGSSTWVARSVNLSVLAHAVVAGHQLEVKVVVANGSGDDLWLAYDTVHHPTSLALP